MKFADLRIALVGPLPPPAGGMANQTRQLAELLRGEGAQVEVVQVNAPYRPAWAEKLKGARALFRLVPYLLRLWQAAGQANLVHVMANSGWSWHLFAAPAVWIATLRGATGAERTLRARLVVNAAGPWVAQFLDACTPTPARHHPRMIRGSHIVVRRLFDHEFAYIFQAPDRPKSDR